MCRQQDGQWQKLTVCWHVDNLFIGYENPKAATRFLKRLSPQYLDKKLNIIPGPRHDYLGMNLEF